MKKYNQEHLDFLKSNCKGKTCKEIAKMFSKKFFLVTAKQISNLKKRYKIISFGKGVTKFEKGHIPFNKGLKGVNGYSNTRFKKGQKPHNTLPLGTERITKDGYIEVKIKEPNKWKLKQRIIWEEHYGKIPKNHIVIFSDKNISNFNIDNLLLVSRNELLCMNKHGLISEDKDLTKAGNITAKIKIKINEILKNDSNNNKKQ